jgi:hypothetical protein
MVSLLICAGELREKPLRHSGFCYEMGPWSLKKQEIPCQQGLYVETVRAALRRQPGIL